jgi:hypothetical protein
MTRRFRYEYAAVAASHRTQLFLKTARLRQSLLGTVKCQNVSRPSAEFVGIGDSGLS